MTRTGHRDRKHYIFSEKPRKCLAFVGITWKVTVLQAYEIFNVLIFFILFNPFSLGKTEKLDF